MRAIGRCLLLWTAVVLMGRTQAQPETAARIAALLLDYTGAVPGAAVLVLRAGVPVFRRAYGCADLERHVAATPALLQVPTRTRGRCPATVTDSKTPPGAHSRRRSYASCYGDQSSGLTTSALCTPRTPSVSRAISSARSIASFECALPLR
jgi:hypothetical protein